LSGQTADLWEQADSAIVAHASPMESGQITARVLSLTPTDAWTKAGVTLRADTTPDAAHAITVVTPGQGSAFQHRESAGQPTRHSAGPSVTAPYWVRLAWKDGAVIASTSNNGQAWTEIGRALVSFPGPPLPGLCLSGHQSQAQASAGFDQVKIEPYQGP
jgi:hypothetical protein